MITFAQAIKLTKPTDNEIIWLRKAGLNKFGKAHDKHPMTMKNAREKLDFKAIIVHEIRPVFIFYEYEGLEYVVSNKRMSERR